METKRIPNKKTQQENKVEMMQKKGEKKDPFNKQ